jgi:hypothetical protein
MKLSDRIDLANSLKLLFKDSEQQLHRIQDDAERQHATAQEILHRFSSTDPNDRRELVLLADEVGLGKTYVALAVAVSVLDAIRKGEQPDDLPAQKPVVLVLTPDSEALYNKWRREAVEFKQKCAKGEGLDWLQIDSPRDSAQSGNAIDLTDRIRQAKKSQPLLLIAKLRSFGAALAHTEHWRKAGLVWFFEHWRVGGDERKSWCRDILGTWSKANVGELLDLRKAGGLWEPLAAFLPNPRNAYDRALKDDKLCEVITKARNNRDVGLLIDQLDWLARVALFWDWPQIPLVVIDEVHNLKNQYAVLRRNLERALTGNVHRLLGLSATPFQLGHFELLNVLGLRHILRISPDRDVALTGRVNALETALSWARSEGEEFRQKWAELRPDDRQLLQDHWQRMAAQPRDQWAGYLKTLHPSRLTKFLESASRLEEKNRQVEKELRPLVIRHRRARNYRAHFVGDRAKPGSAPGSPHFAWAPGMEIPRRAELAQYLLMRAVSLADGEKKLPPLGAEMTGSYRHLVQTSAVWKRLGKSANFWLNRYQEVLDGILATDTADRRHPKILLTTARVLKAFNQGQKTLIFCVYVKTAEALRDELRRQIDELLAWKRKDLFEDAQQFKNFHNRFFNRREPLYNFILDQPLLGEWKEGSVGIPETLRLEEPHLRTVASILVDHGEEPRAGKPDRRLLLAAVEHVAVRAWPEIAEGEEWLGRSFETWPALRQEMAEEAWLQGRRALMPSTRTVAETEDDAPEAEIDLEEESPLPAGKQGKEEREHQVAAWMQTLREKAIGELLTPYFRLDLFNHEPHSLPLLVRFHAGVLRKLNPDARILAGQVFRRMLMAEEFLFRYLAGVEKENSEKWVHFLARSYEETLPGQGESLRDRVTAYLETLLRVQNNPLLLQGYRDAGKNKHAVQLVQGSTHNRDRYFLGFNTPYRPEILIATQVGQEGIDLHRECRHVIHHDLWWNPGVVEQRTGRVDRIGSKVERERSANDGPEAATLDVAVPYLAATYDERVFEEVHRRAELFEVTMGGDVHIDGKVVELDPEGRKAEGIDAEGEELGTPGETTGIALPSDMVDKLRINLAVWKPPV